MDSKKPPVKKSKAKKPKVKKPKPKPKTKQKQKQAQTQNVIINLSDIRKRTRRKMTGSGTGRPLPLSSFSGSAQAPVYVNPQGSAYRDLIRPIKEHQREMRAAAQDDLRRSDQQRELLRSEFKKSQAGQSAINKALIDALRETKQRGNVEQVTPPPTAGDLEVPLPAPTVGNLQDSDEQKEKADLQKDAFDESRRMDDEQPEGTAVPRRDAFESSSEPTAPAPGPAPIPEAVVLPTPTKISKTRLINRKIKDYEEKNGKLPTKNIAKGFSRNNEFQALNVSKADIETALKKYKKK